MLKREGVEHSVLNAKHHEKEAEILAQAGQYGAVTIATNMAGRGVDIILGGNPIETKSQLKVKEVGGLHVIGTERHEARRIDDQLRGRAGRQGDPGSSQFFVSTEDDVIRIFGGDRLKNLMDTLGVGEDDVIENRLISRAIEQSQTKIEGHNFDIRKYVLEYDDVVNKHRETIYNLRRKIVDCLGSKIHESRIMILDYIENVIERVVDFHTVGDDDQWNLREIEETVKTITNHELRIMNKEYKTKDELQEKVIDFIEDVYEEKEKEVGEENMRKLEKAVLLRTIDEIWMDHIEAMEYLRDSVRLRAYGQRDPLVEYKIEGQKMFDQLQQTIESQVANLIFKASFTIPPKVMQGEEKRLNVRNGGSDQLQQVKRSNDSNTQPKVGRNDPCHCGSGKKFKKCHGK
jgi:preprotein translocase subunit SecA